MANPSSSLPPPYYHPTNKTNNDGTVVCEQIEKTIPTTLVVPCQETANEQPFLLKDACDSHHLINVLEIPNSLSFIINKTLEVMMEEKMIHSATPVHIQAWRPMAIGMYQLKMIEMEKSLWTMYYRSGTANVLKSNESTLKLWPTCLKSMIRILKPAAANTKNDSNSMEFDPDLYLKFVTKHLRELNEQEKQIQAQLSKKKTHFHNCTNRMEEMLQICIQKYTELLRFQYEYKVQFVELNYRETVLENKFLQENPNEQQKLLIERLLCRKYHYETAKQEVLLMKHHMTHNQLPKSLHSVSIALSSSIHSLTDRNLCEHLQERHFHVTKQYKNEMMKLFLEIVETKLLESQQLFDIETAKLWQNQRSLPIEQRLNHTMMQLMKSQLTLIARKVACIYNYKTIE